MADKNPLYPTGPIKDLGNESPDVVLGTFSGNEIGALMWGERKHREAYTKKYGYDKTIGLLEKALKNNKHFEGQENEQGAWWSDAKAYYDELLALQGS